MRRVIFEGLEQGMLLVWHKLIIGTNSKDDFFEGKPSLKYFGIRDSFYGARISEATPGATYTILHERGTKEYQEVVNKLLQERREYIRDAEKDCEMLRGFLG